MDSLNNSYSEGSIESNASLSELRAPVECTICLSYLAPTDNLQVLNCAHTFHSDCIVRWISNNRSCPVCRSRVELPLECFDQMNTRRRIRRYRRNILAGTMQINDPNGTMYRETRSSILRRQYGTRRRQHLQDSSPFPPNSAAVDYAGSVLPSQIPENEDIVSTNISVTQGNDQFVTAEPRVMAALAALMRYNQANSQP